MNSHPEVAGSKESTTRVGVLMNVPALLGKFGVDPHPIFVRTGLDMQLFSDPDQKLPYLQLSHFLAECVEATQCQHFGLLIGQTATSTHLGLAGYVISVAMDVETALIKLIDYFDLHDTGGAPTLHVYDQLTMFGYTVTQPGVRAIEQIYDLTIAFAATLLRGLCGPAWRPSQVLLSRRQPANTPAYRDFFRCTPRFNSEVSAIAFPSKWLKQSVASADAHLLARFEQDASESRRLRQLELVQALSQQLQRGLLEGFWSAGETAQIMGLNRHTMRRRLKAKGTGFRQEIDKVRLALSLQLLEGTNIAVAEISGLLGYRNSSAFIRAFNRWTGTTPNVWRQACRS
jgi:AraC-like DNA-binding protein